MERFSGRLALLALSVAGISLGGPQLSAQSPAPAAAAPRTCMPQGFLAPPPAYQSVEVLADGRVTFRLCAPDAQQARVTSSDIADIIPMGFPPGTPMGLAMTKDGTGLWSVTTDKPVPADIYRFNFQVDGARVPNPQGTSWSEERTGINSTFEVKGPEGAFQTYDRAVPHGVVS